MLDDSVKERLKTLTVEEVQEALHACADCITGVRQDQREITIVEYPWFGTLQALYPNIPDVISPEQDISLAMTPYTVSYLERHNEALHAWLVERRHARPAMTARILSDSIAMLRDIFDEVAHAPDWTEQNFDSSYHSFLSELARPGRLIPISVTKKTNIEDYIRLILKDVKQLHPEIYQQYHELRRAATGDTPLLQAVKQTVSHRYFSGSIGSFCPLFLPDILNSPQFKAMGEHPKHQLILLDMIDLCNYLAGSRHGSSIETNGFHYTWSDCHIEASEDTFQKAIKEIVSRGWFRVVGKAKLDDCRLVTMYVPSTDWKSKRLSPHEVSRIQDYGVRKQTRIADSKERYARSKSRTGAETNTHDETGVTHMTIMC